MVRDYDDATTHSESVRLMVQVRYDSMLLPGAIVNRAYGIHKNLYIPLFLLTLFGPIYYDPP